MRVTVSDIAACMEQIAPLSQAENWDNVGLQVGHAKRPVQRIALALDPSIEAVSFAIDIGAEMLITHHPLFFAPIKSIDLSTPLGMIVERLILAGISVYCAHTNLDAASGGINDMLARKIGLTDIGILSDSSDPGADYGIGRTGRLKEPLSLEKLADHIKQALDIPTVKIAGDPEQLISNAAVCSGSGSSLMGEFMRSGAQVYISGDLRYHDATAAVSAGIGLIDIGHFQSEHLAVPELAAILTKMMKGKGLPVDVEVFDREYDPFHTK
jgi:dinuclear metal center YbgI/SA1388 family protein